MQHLFESASKYVIIFASDDDSNTNYHVRWRKFSKWVKENKSNWEMIKKIENKNFENDFYIYKKIK